MQLVVVLFYENPVECRLDFNPLRCEILRIRLITHVEALNETYLLSALSSLIPLIT